MAFRSFPPMLFRGQLISAIIHCVMQRRLPSVLMSISSHAEGNCLLALRLLCHSNTAILCAEGHRLLPSFPKQIAFCPCPPYVKRGQLPSSVPPLLQSGSRNALQCCLSSTRDHLSKILCHVYPILCIQHCVSCANSVSVHMFWEAMVTVCFTCLVGAAVVLCLTAYD